MKHLGDITKINGATIPPVEVITAGSPCQDLSVAGKRAGLGGQRSGLFMDSVRIVKQMREATNNEYPRYFVWENVPGAFSSNFGNDFTAVLEELCRVVNPDATVDVPEGTKQHPVRWAKHGAIIDRQRNYCIAWRTMDAQFWGVPQRRRRISLVADFRGCTPPQILFEPEGLRGHFTPRGEARQSPTADIESGTGTAECYGISSYASNAMKSSNPNSGIYKAATSRTLDLNGGNPACNQGGIAVVNTNVNPLMLEMTSTKNTVIDSGISPTLTARMGTGGNQVNAVCQADQREPVTYPGVGITSKQNASNPAPGDPCHTLNTDQRNYVVYPETARSLTARYDSSPCVDRGQNFVCRENHSVVMNLRGEEEKANTIKARDYKGIGRDDTLGSAVMIANAIDNAPTLGLDRASFNQGKNAKFNFSITDNVSSTCVAKGPNAVFSAYTVRRLTPLECERLQGYPDSYTDLGEWTDSKGKLHKPADSPRYKALGNSIALPQWYYVLDGISRHLASDAKIGSLFDGIGGFPLVWSDIHGGDKSRCAWASEIEEFPIAVTKRHFPE